MYEIPLSQPFSQTPQLDPVRTERVCEGSVFLEFSVSLDLNGIANGSSQLREGLCSDQGLAPGGRDEKITREDFSTYDSGTEVGQIRI